MQGVKKILTLVMLCGALVGASTLSFAQTSAASDVKYLDVGDDTHPPPTYVGPSVADYQAAIETHKTVILGRVAIDGVTTVEFYEKPKDIVYFDSSMLIRRKGEPDRVYRIGRMIRHQPLVLAHASIIRWANNTGMLVCEYEGGAVGAREGFAILRFSPSGIDLHVLPLTDFGKVVVFKSEPNRAEIWSALPDLIVTDADPMFYATRTCEWRPKRYVCGSPKRQPGSFAPAEIDDPGIEVRP